LSYIDTKNLHKVPEEQRKQFEELLKAYPQINIKSKMETARELNTPAAQDLKKGIKPPQPPVAEDELDLSAIQEQQDYQKEYTPKNRALGEMKVDHAHSNYQSIKAEEKAEEQYQKRHEEPSVPVAEQTPKKKTTKFSPIGKQHPVMAKMRHSLGLDNLETILPAIVSGVTYELHRLVRSDIIKASALANLKSKDEIELKSNIESALIAYATKKIDGVALEDVLDAPLKELKYSTGKEEALTPAERVDKGHQLFYGFLVDSPTEFTDLLVVHYEQHYQPLSLLADDQQVALCPDANCKHKAIIAKNDKRFCPYHGSELRKEVDLPNPS